MRIAYLDCFSGISGDMTLAALVDAGADPAAIERELRKLPLEAFDLEWKTVVKKGVTARKLDVVTHHAGHHGSHQHGHDHHCGQHDEHCHGHGHQHQHGERRGHDHAHHHGEDHEHSHGHHHGEDHEHSHGHHHGDGHGHDHEHHHGDDHEHSHGHHHGDGHGHDHAHHHRTYREIAAMIQQAGLPPRATERALAVFRAIGQAEAKIHNTSLESVHFHEVGALDSIVDIVGIALALEALDVDELWSGPVPTGNGYVRCQHGLYPVPAPATLELLKGIPLRSTPLQYELTTPTGAGIAAALVKRFGPLPSMRVESIGYGAGTRDLPDQPNVLRVLIGTPDEG